MWETISSGTPCWGLRRFQLNTGKLKMRKIQADQRNTDVLYQFNISKGVAVLHQGFTSFDFRKKVRYKLNEISMPYDTVQIVWKFGLRFVGRNLKKRWNHHLRRKTTENVMDNVIFLTVDLTLLKAQTFSMLIVFHVIGKRTECANRPLYLVRFLFLIRTMWNCQEDVRFVFS